MSSKFTIIVVASASLAVFTAAGSAAQASSAAPRSVSYRQTAPAGVGYGNGVTTPYGMLSAPVSGAHYVGTAYPGDDLADACYSWSGGQEWQLVLDRAGRSNDHYPATAGFLPQAVLTSNPVNGVQCPPSFNFSDSVGQNGLATMYSAPHSDTYVVGTAHGSDAIFDLCAVTVNSTPWIWVLDTSGWAGDHYANTTGFLPYWELVNDGAIGIPC